MTKEIITAVNSNGTDRTELVRQATQAIECIFSRCPKDAKIIVNTSMGRGLQTKEYPLDEANVALRIGEQFAGTGGLPRVYLRATVLKQDTSLAQGQRGKRQDTYGSSVLWADLDPSAEEDLTTYQARTLDTVQNFRLPPSLIVSSGRGLHAYWFIPFTTDWQRVERINKAISAELGSDSTFDAARLLRMPGTFNDKPEAQCFAQVVEIYPDRIYEDLDQFPQAPLESDEQKLLGETFETEDLPLGFEGKVKAESMKLWDRIQSKDTAIAAGAATKIVQGNVEVDRSSNDFSIAIQLLRLGMTPGQVFAVLSHPTWFSGAKFQEGHNEYYVRRTIAKAASFIGEVELSKIAEIAKRLEERYVIMHHQLTWWIYSHERGVFVPGRTELALAIQALAGNKWTKNLHDGVFLYLQERHHQSMLPEAPGLLNVSNGMLRWNASDSKVELLEASPGYRSIYQVDAAWDPEADCTEIDAAVARVFTPEAARIWWMFCGFCLHTGDDKSIRCLFAIVGPKRRGKTTMLLLLKEFLGSGNVSSISLSELTGEGNQFTTSRMVGKLLNLDVDAPYEVPARKLSLLKKLAERQAVPIERKFEGSEEVDLVAKLAFAMNDYPKFGISDDAVYDRWVVLQPREDLLPMYPGKNGGVANLHKVLMADPRNRSAWLLRSIEGLRDLMKAGGFPDIEVVVAGRNRMRFESDSIYRFWLECTDEAQGERVEMSILYELYKSHAMESGVRAVAGRNTFVKDSRNFGTDGVIPGLQIFDQKDPGYRQATAVGRRPKGFYSLPQRLTGD